MTFDLFFRLYFKGDARIRYRPYFGYNGVSQISGTLGSFNRNNLGKISRRLLESLTISVV